MPQRPRRRRGDRSTACGAKIRIFFRRSGIRLASLPFPPPGEALLRPTPRLGAPLHVPRANLRLFEPITLEDAHREPAAPTPRRPRALSEDVREPDDQSDPRRRSSVETEHGTSPQNRRWQRARPPHRRRTRHQSRVAQVPRSRRATLREALAPSRETLWADVDPDAASRRRSARHIGEQYLRRACGPGQSFDTGPIQPLGTEMTENCEAPGHVRDDGRAAHRHVSRRDPHLAAVAGDRGHRRVRVGDREVVVPEVRRAGRDLRRLHAEMPPRC